MSDTDNTTTAPRKQGLSAALRRIGDAAFITIVMLFLMGFFILPLFPLFVSLISNLWETFLTGIAGVLQLPGSDTTAKIQQAFALLFLMVIALGYALIKSIGREKLRQWIQVAAKLLGLMGIIYLLLLITETGVIMGGVILGASTVFLCLVSLYMMSLCWTSWSTSALLKKTIYIYIVLAAIFAVLGILSILFGVLLIFGEIEGPDGFNFVAGLFGYLIGALAWGRMLDEEDHSQ